MGCPPANQKAWNRASTQLDYNPPSLAWSFADTPGLKIQTRIRNTSELEYLFWEKRNNMMFTIASSQVHKFPTSQWFPQTPIPSSQSHNDGFSSIRKESELDLFPKKLSQRFPEAPGSQLVQAKPEVLTTWPTKKSSALAPLRRHTNATQIPAEANQCRLDVILSSRNQKNTTPPGMASRNWQFLDWNHQ